MLASICSEQNKPLAWNQRRHKVCLYKHTHHKFQQLMLRIQNEDLLLKGFYVACGLASVKHHIRLTMCLRAVGLLLTPSSGPQIVE